MNHLFKLMLLSLGTVVLLSVFNAKSVQSPMNDLNSRPTLYFPAVPFPYVFEGTQEDVTDWNIASSWTFLGQTIDQPHLIGPV